MLLLHKLNKTISISIVLVSEWLPNMDLIFCQAYSKLMRIATAIDNRIFPLLKSTFKMKLLIDVLTLRYGSTKQKKQKKSALLAEPRQNYASLISTFASFIKSFRVSTTGMEIKKMCMPNWFALTADTCKNDNERP